ncbi:MAG TPA: alpha/beta hydrolase [Steroidobacteraceae bacterium]|jgi:pimeloyl-ACP methyl ester carboxylesterase|nr:alpha/beta hydrolase [Steroidobacteraceae bacterium]
MRRARKAVALGSLLAAGAARAALAAATLTLTPCEIEHPLRLSVIPAECGVLEVPENPAEPHGRQLGLHVARVGAISRRKQPDPLFVLAGGPGAAAGAFYASVAPAFARIQRDRDIVLLDQRGTGGSNPLECTEPADLAERASEDEIVAATRACLASLAGRADPAYYTTSLAVQDLERVRVALGVDRINLYAASYGTRVAQQYLRRFPARVRSMILDGVVPIAEPMGATSAIDAEAALQDILRRCAQEAYCRGRFGDPAADYRAVRAALAGNRAVAVSIVDPASGEARRLSFTAETLASVLRLLSYVPEYAALLPLLLHAGAQQDYAPLASQYLMVERAYAETIATGMHNSVVCAEDVPFFAAHPIERAHLAATYLGTRQLDGLEAVCRVWPRGAADEDLHAPLHSDVPALLLSGSDDPATPPAYARAVAGDYTHKLDLVLEGFGHGQLTSPCVDRIMAQFIAHASVESLDVSCVRAARPLAFFTSLNGPPP